ncbi:MAG TPA: DUF934 domain-containing protein [Polyangiaceae bacterium]|jgi:uncharacterized protein (DUF934 family)|nr:DUF934 domain-containing protein [Polyangiaceae bacterium]
MRVIKNKQIIEDSWRLLPDNAIGETGVPNDGDVIVSLERWSKDHSSLAKRAGKTGVVVRSDEDPATIPALESLPLIAIDFPKFTDGRGYSHARLLRERQGYKGELRAVGNVLRDQLFYMFRCGIDSFCLQAGKDINGALEAFDEFNVTYQAAADERRPLYRRVAR